MRDFSIDLIWTKVQIAITALGGWLGYFLGGMDGLMIVLIVLMTLPSPVLFRCGKYLFKRNCSVHPE